jgi:hypothetical protein
MIVVEMQNDFVESGAALETPAARQIVPKIAEALRVCAALLGSKLSTRRMCTVGLQPAREHHSGANARSNLEPAKFERSEMGFLGERRDRSVQEQLLYPPIRRFG